MIKFIQLYGKGNQSDQQVYYKEVVEGLTNQKKSLPNKYIYNEEGSQLFSQINFLSDYYPSHSEKQIFVQQGSSILEALGKQKFNLVELGAGDALKTKILIQQAVKEQYNFEYIPIDISHASNLQLADNIKKISQKISMTILTADYEDGVKWVYENKKQRNVFFILGNNLGNYLQEDLLEFLNWMKGFLKKDDIMVIGLDMLKNISLIQKAYSLQSKLWYDYEMGIIKRINEELKGTFDLKQFYPHTIYDPQLRCIKQFIVSSCDQTVKIRQKQFSFIMSQAIFIGISRKFSPSQADKVMKALDTKLVKYFTDKNEYIREYICIKQ